MYKNVVISILVLLFGVFFMSPFNTNEPELIEIEYTVQKNDTLWTVLKDRVGEKVDVRNYIYLTAQRNDGVLIKEGEKITLIIPKD